MGFDVENAAKILGNNIMIERKNRGLSQYELADGICSQSMISSIEKGHYVPNSILLAQLCNKLGISIHNAMLNNFFEIGESRENTKKDRKSL
ncbi:helix-turn-helix domain-containing protein [Fructilactobacillus florum]|uniref:helix-turn-helix domain-containing protein n=1 Tax=Fructilactobacillus florum TaxID=640331 RepID=UPI0006D17ECB|nr:helix-turn-helix transcriptional regulator [Fructilactobacillus florum]